MLAPYALKLVSPAAAALASLIFGDSVQGQALAVLNNTQDVPTGFPPCDALIEANLSHAVYFPTSSRYKSLVEAYWSLSTRKSPWCFVLPDSAAEVSQTITALRSAGDGAGDWHIAIRSGGHGSDNSNNVVQGVTIDLSQLNATTYDAAQNTVSLGTGARWQQVYEDLEPNEVMVAGGREGAVGVGGFVLGGGISWYTPRAGFVCDTVVNYEIVMANGEIINANASANSDLWRALKGGASNFGIVTRFDVEAIPATNFTIESRAVGAEYAGDVVDAFVGFNNLNESFKDNALLAVASYSPQTGNISMQVTEVNTMNDANSTAFEAFNRIPTLTPRTKASVTVTESANSTVIPNGTRNAGSLLTIANDPKVLSYSIDQHNNLVADLKTMLGPQNFSSILDFQPLAAYLADIGAQKGGNMLGLGQSSGNKIMLTSAVSLLTPGSANEYSKVYQLVGAMFQRIKAFAVSVGSSEQFLYLNYADAYQNPIGSYGTANVDFIRQVASKYDPQGFFQHRVPSGFKINRVARKD